MAEPITSLPRTRYLSPEFPKSSSPPPVQQLPADVTQRNADVFETASVQSASTASTAPQAVLARGQQGPAVEAWQRTLIRLGYLTPADFATGPGIFGPKTEAATKQFQREHGLDPSGKVGPKTTAMAKSETQELIDAEKTTLKEGMSNAAVRRWQSRLVRMGYLSEDYVEAHPGVFTAKTAAATRQFQQDYGLTVSGKVGPATRKKMVEALHGQAQPKNASVDVRNISQLYSDGTEDDWNRLSNCGPTSVAMIAKAFGFQPDKSDGYTVNWLGQQAGVGPDGAGWSQVQTMARAAGLTASDPMFGDDLGWIDQQLAAGKKIAANGDRGVTLAHSSYTDGVTGGHWIVIKGKDANGNYLVEDPSTDCKVLSPSELQRYFDTRAGGGVAVAIGP